MEQVILLYECDKWHSHKSMELLGVFSDFDKFAKAAREYVSNHVENFREYEEDTPSEIVESTMEYFLDEWVGHVFQTQGYDVNLYAECVELNQLFT